MSCFVALADDNGMKASNPVQYRRLAAFGDQVTYPIFRLAGWMPRIAVIDLRFPSSRNGAEEPLWVNGEVPTADFLYVYYISPTAIQFGFESMGHGGPVSDVIPISYAQAHRLELVLGPFLPPRAHPYYRRLGLGEGAALGQLLRVKLDGRYVLDALVDYHQGKERFSWGFSDKEHAFGERFTGPAFHLHWVPFEKGMVEDYLEPSLAGPLRLNVRWPTAGAERSEPLVALGAKNRGALLWAHFRGPDTVQLVLGDSAGLHAEGSPFRIVPGSVSPVVVDLPGLHAFPLQSGTLELNPVPERAWVSVDEHRVLETPERDFGAGPRSLVTGRNTLLVSGVADTFSGEVARLK